MLRSARSSDDFRPLIGNNRFPRPATPRAVSRCSKTDRSKLTIPPRYSKFSLLFFSRKPANGSMILFPAHPSENAAKKTRDTLPCVARESSYFQPLPLGGPLRLPAAAAAVAGGRSIDLEQCGGRGAHIAEREDVVLLTGGDGRTRILGRTLERRGRPVRRCSRP